MILDIETFGVLENDYDRFFRSRINAICKELKKRIIVQDGDKMNQVSNPSEEETEN